MPFYSDEAKTLGRLIFLQELVAEQALRAEPCPLLKSQLNELDVLVDRLSHEVHKMQAIVEKCESREKK